MRVAKSNKIDKKILLDNITEIIDRLEKDGKVDITNVVKEINTLAKENLKELAEEEKTIKFSENHINEIFKKETSKNLSSGDRLDNVFLDKINPVFFKGYPSIKKDFKKVELNEFSQKLIEKRKDWYKTPYYDYENGDVDEGKKELKMLNAFKNSENDFIESIKTKVEDNVLENMLNIKTHLTKKQIKYMEFQHYMLEGMKKTIEDTIPQANKKIRKNKNFEEYKIDKKNISKGDIKLICNILSEKEIYDINEIKKDMAYTKVVTNSCKDKEELNKMTETFYDFTENNKYKLEGEIRIENFKKDMIETAIDEGGVNHTDFFKKRIYEYEFILKPKNEEEMEILSKKFGEPQKLHFEIFRDEEPIFNTETTNFGSEGFRKFEEAIKYIKGDEYYDNMDLTNIKDWEKLKDEGIINIAYKPFYSSFKDEYKDYGTYYEDCLINHIVNNVLKKAEDEIVEKIEKYNNDKDGLKREQNLLEKNIEKKENNFKILQGEIYHFNKVLGDTGGIERKEIEKENLKERLKDIGISF